MTSQKKSCEPTTGVSGTPHNINAKVAFIINIMLQLVGVICTSPKGLRLLHASHRVQLRVRMSGQNVAGRAVPGISVPKPVSRVRI